MTSRTTPTALTVLVLVLFLNVADGRPQSGTPSKGRNTDVSARQGGHLGVQNTIGDLLRHPAFAGFAPLILPWDDRAYDEQMPLTRIGSLLPYHTHVDPETVTSGLNRMIDDAAGGKTVFYRFYSDAQTAAAACDRARRGCSSFADGPAPHSRSSPLAADSRTSPPSTRAFRTRRRSAARDTTRSC